MTSVNNSFVDFIFSTTRGDACIRNGNIFLTNLKGSNEYRIDYFYAKNTIALAQFFMIRVFDLKCVRARNRFRLRRNSEIESKVIFDHAYLNVTKEP